LSESCNIFAFKIEMFLLRLKMRKSCNISNTTVMHIFALKIKCNVYLKLQIIYMVPPLFKISSSATG